MGFLGAYSHIPCIFRNIPCFSGDNTEKSAETGSLRTASRTTFFLNFQRRALRKRCPYFIPISPSVRGWYNVDLASRDHLSAAILAQYGQVSRWPKYWSPDALLDLRRSQAVVNPSILRCPAQSSGILLILMILRPVRSGGCDPSMMAEIISGAMKLSLTSCCKCRCL